MERDWRALLVLERGEPADDGRRGGGGEVVPPEGDGPARKFGMEDSAAIVCRRFCRCASDAAGKCDCSCCCCCSEYCRWCARCAGGGCRADVDAVGW